MKDRGRQLRKELLAAGASQAEVKDLLPLASRLRLLKDAGATAEAKTRWLAVVKPATLVVSGLALGVFIIAVPQAVLPTSWLYPVQKLSDNAAIALHPQYRANVMMKRAQQVNQLVADHAGPKPVLATLADYTKQANAYKTAPHSNYAAFEYCKTNLQQAAAAAPANIRQAINDSLDSLNAT